VKKVILAFLLACTAALSFSIPVVADVTVVVEEINITAEQGEITPFSEYTRNYFRMPLCGCGNLQFRVWGMVSGRWLTEWTYINSGGCGN